MIKSHINSQRGELDMTDCISCRTVALREEKIFERPENYSATHSKNCTRVFIAQKKLKLPIHLKWQQMKAIIRAGEFQAAHSD